MRSRRDSLPFAAPVRPAGRLEQLRSMPYGEYRRSPEFCDTRALALSYARRTCTVDPSHVVGVDVHHVSTARIGTEHAEDLAVLCSDCAAQKI